MSDNAMDVFATKWKIIIIVITTFGLMVQIVLINSNMEKDAVGN